MNILITGANGGYGSYAVDYVKEFAPNDNIFALVRKESDAQQLKTKGVNVRIADYANLDAMIKAFEGIDRLLFVSVPIFELQRNVVEAAKISGVKFIAYTSLNGLEYEKFGLEINHRQTEKLIRESGIPHTFLRDNWYLEIAAPLVLTAIETKRFPYYSGEGKVSWALKREYAEAGARVITGEDYPEILNFAGKPVSFRELGEVAQAIAGEKIEIIKTTKAEFNEMMANSGISEQGLMFANYWQDYALKGNNGEAELTTDDLERVIGHNLTPLSEAIKEMK